MSKSQARASYIEMLRLGFAEYRRARFAGQDHLFNAHLDGGAVVFSRDHLEANSLIPPFAAPRHRITI